MYHVQGKGFKTIAQDLRMSKNTIKRHIKGNSTRDTYKRTVQPYKVLEAYKHALVERLVQDREEPKRRRRTARKLFEELCSAGYSGGYGAINNFVKNWKLENNLQATTVFVL